MKLLRIYLNFLIFQKKSLNLNLNIIFFFKFRNSLNIFDLKTNFLKILISYIKTILTFFYLIFFSNKENKEKYFEIIIDDVDYNTEYNRTKEVGKKFESYLIVGSLKKNE